MSARTYDPFSIERPKLRLGEHGEWELGELHEARYARFKEWYAEFQSISDKDDATLADIANVVGELVSVSCLGADEAPEVLVDICDAEKHGDAARGLQTLQGIVKFLLQWASGEESAGNG